MSGEKSPETLRDGLTLMQWAQREHTRLQYEVDFLWDDMDHLQLKADFEAQLQAYNDLCDKMDLLETHPECLFAGHYWISEWEPGVDRDVMFERCERCGVSQIA